MPLMDERIDDQAFAKILHALSKQYECDIANAFQRGKDNQGQGLSGVPREVYDQAAVQC